MRALAKGAMRFSGAALLGTGLFVGVTGPASAGPCTDIFNSANGMETIPGTNVGTVSAGGVCQIGDVNGSPPPASAAEVNSGGSANPSNYEFTFGGGDLTIQELIGPTSVGVDVDAELDSYIGGIATLIPGASIEMFGSSASTTPATLFAGYLAAGNYIVNTYLAGSSGDPQFQVNFAIPEPASFPLLAVALAGLAAFVRRRKA